MRNLTKIVLLCSAYVVVIGGILVLEDHAGNSKPSKSIPNKPSNTKVQSVSQVNESGTPVKKTSPSSEASPGGPAKMLIAHPTVLDTVNKNQGSASASADEGNH